MEYTFNVDEKLQDLIDTSITIQDKERTYGIAVSKFIRQYYSENRVESIINNYLDDASEKHIAEFKELQNFRKACKAYAKQLLEMN